MDLSAFLEIFGISSADSWISLPADLSVLSTSGPMVWAIVFFIVGLLSPLVVSYFLIAVFRWIWFGVQTVLIPISIHKWRNL